MSDELKEITPGEFLLWLLHRRKRFRITGDSMLPLLRPDEEVLLNPHAYQKRTPRPGDIVVARHPYHPDLQLVKRIARITDDGSCYLEGNNPTESTDSRTFGPVSSQNLLGQVTCRFS